MKIKIMMLLSLITTIKINAQDTIDTLPAVFTEYKALVLSANKVPEKSEDISAQINVIKRKNIQTLMPQTTADALIQNGTVFVQKSQMGGGSPVIRGFEANKVLLVVDGIRMNNAIYRGGHLQNIISIDPNALDRIEVFNGPGSIIYGSDALGGVVHMFTLNPKLSTTDSSYTRASGFARTATANKEFTLHGDVSYGKRNWASLTSITISSFGDMTMGKNNGFYKNDSAYGNKLFYATRLNDRDTNIANNNPQRQLFSGYQQVDLIQKFLLKSSGKVSHLINLQHSNTSNVPRYDRLTETVGNNPRFAEWYYGPQTRSMAAYTLQLNNFRLYDKGNVSIAFQNIAESRFDRRFQSNNLRANEEKVKVYSLNGDFSKLIARKHEVNYGTEVFYNKVASIGTTTNINTNQKTGSVSRYPNGSDYLTAGIYATDRWEIREDLIISVGGRFNYFSLNANFDSTFFKFNQLSVSQSNFNGNGHLGIVLKPYKFLRVVAQMSSGFRNPNIDDVSKTFEQNTAFNSITLPNPNLRSEMIFSQELGFDLLLSENTWLDFRAYNSDFSNAIAVQKSTYNGNDSIFFAGGNKRVYQAVNLAKANIYGFSSTINVYMNQNWSLKASYNYTYGRDRSNENNIVPLDHIPPAFATLFLGYHKKNFNALASVLYNGKKNILDYSTSGEDNPQYAPSYGTPMWYTINLKVDYTLNNKWVFRAGIENIMDMNYRYFASGFSNAGRNFIISAGFKF